MTFLCASHTAGLAFMIMGSRAPGHTEAAGKTNRASQSEPDETTVVTSGAKNSCMDIVGGRGALENHDECEQEEDNNEAEDDDTSAVWDDENKSFGDKQAEQSRHLVVDSEEIMGTLV